MSWQVRYCNSGKPVGVSSNGRGSCKEYNKLHDALKKAQTTGNSATIIAARKALTQHTAQCKHCKNTIQSKPRKRH